MVLVGLHCSRLSTITLHYFPPSLQPLPHSDGYDSTQQTLTQGYAVSLACGNWGRCSPVLNWQSTTRSKAAADLDSRWSNVKVIKQHTAGVQRRKGYGYPKDSMPLSQHGLWGMLLCRQASPHSTYWIKVMETETPLLFSAYPRVRFTYLFKSRWNSHKPF